MFLIMISFTFAMMIMTPASMAFSVVLSSLTVSMWMYMETQSVFPPSGVVVSFSSGMMIVFCYCTVMVNHEEKKSMNPSMLFMVFILSMAMIISAPSVANKTSSPMNCSSLMESMMILVTMVMVILAMVSINSVMFNPTKNMSSSY